MKQILHSVQWPLLLAILLFAMSVFSLSKEITPFFSETSSPALRFANLEQGQADLGISIAAQKLLFNDCLESFAGPAGMAQPSIRRSAMLKHCQTLAKDSTNSKPSFAFAWYIGAFTAAELGEYQTFNHQLSASQKTAPNEQWLAEFRVNLAEDNFDQLDSSTLQGHNDDLKLLVQSRKGVSSIAKRYIQQNSFRERITNIVETLSQDDQRRFIVNVRSAAQQQRVNIQ